MLSSTFTVYRIARNINWQWKACIGESILIRQNFAYQSFTVHMVLSELKIWDSINP